MKAFAREGVALSETTPLQNLERLVEETQGLQADSAAQWEARGELRPRAGAEDEVWLHLQAQATVPLTCQRCMGAVQTPLKVDQWYRFVASEDIAMAEDDQAEEDLLVMEPQFNLLAVLEDELLMALPLVPMHDECPVAPKLQADEAPGPEAAGEGELGAKPSPFAVLAQLKNKK